MSSLKIYFSVDEMRTFLSMKGYKFTDVDCWDSHNAYHNDVEYTDHKVQIAHKDVALATVLTDKRKGEVENYSVERVFLKEMKSALLKL